MIKTLDFGFYTVNVDYLEYLSTIDREVYYNSEYRNSIKPFVGIVVGIDNFKYFIPLYSAKEKHKKWKNVSNDHYLIYEVIPSDVIVEGDIYKPYSNTEKIHVLSVLDIKKMIPVPDNSYQKIIFSELNDSRYQDLFEKEYAFCLKIKDKLLSKVDRLYKKQMETGRVQFAHCNFALLERAMEDWIENNRI